MTLTDYKQALLAFLAKRAEEAEDLTAKNAISAIYLSVFFGVIEEGWGADDSQG